MLTGMPWPLWERVAPWLLVRFHHSRPLGDSAVGHRRITMLTWRDGLDVGVLDYQLCHACRTGYVNKISIAPEFQRRGLGRRAISYALARGRGYTWGTSGQSDEGQGVLRRDGPPDRRGVR
jgi:GNAT superfamily N-acetyltransferase